MENYKPPKKRPMEPKALWYVYYPFGYLIAKVLSKYKTITPNKVTFFWLFFGLVPAYFYSRGDLTFALIGAFLVQLVVVGDVIDGRIAELNNMSTALGEWFDGMAALTVDAFIFFGVGYGLYSVFTDVSVWYVTSVILSTNYLIYLAHKIYLMIDPAFRKRQGTVIKGNYWFSLFMWGRAKVYFLLGFVTAITTLLRDFSVLYWFIAALALANSIFYVLLFLFFAQKLRKIDNS